MQHLDDGTLHTLVDGEIGSAELGPIRQHLEQCEECRARLEEAGTWTREADELVDLLEVPVRTAPVAPRRRPAAARWAPRQLAWAASVIAALGLGWAAGTTPWKAAPQGTAPGETLALEQARPAAEAEVPAAADAALKERSVAAPQTQQPEPPARKAESDLAASRESGPMDEVAAAKALANAATAGERRANEGAALGRQLVGGVAQESRRDQAVPASPASMASALRDEAVAKRTAFEPVTLHEAMRQLAGSLRLIEGLVPDGLEAAGGRIRVVYPGGIVLEQWRDADSVVVSLRGPASLAADSLARLAARIR
ncbi:MAG: hypothetical protein AAB075_02595 [Gemmatimonadota bacterium]